MAKFRCKISGTVIEFINPVDIASTKRNPAYEEIKDGLQTKEKQDTKEEVKKPVKKTAKVEE
jgi:hypothetical protein